MARGFGVASFAAAALLVTAAAHAQQLQRLHVLRVVLTGPARVALERPFDVTLTIVLGGRVKNVDNVFLPSFFGAEELGDVRSIAPAAGATIYRETLRLVAHASGPLEISPGYVEAIDARDGKPKRFLSNGLRVEAASVAAPRAPVAIVLPAIALAFALALAFAFALRARRQTPVAKQPPFLPAPVTRPARDAAAEALSALRMHRDRVHVLRLRTALWESLGAREGQTLRDVLVSAGGAHELRSQLMHVEYAAFCAEDALAAAISRVIG